MSPPAANGAISPFAVNDVLAAIGTLDSNPAGNPSINQAELSVVANVEISPTKRHGVGPL